MIAQRTILISGFWINKEKSCFSSFSFHFLFSTCHLSLCFDLDTTHKQGQVILLFKKRFQRTPWCAAIEAGAADFAGDTFPFVLTLTHHSVKDICSRAVAFHPRCKPTPWPLVFITELADLFSLACKPCAIYTVHVHYTVSSHLVSARCFSLHGSELSCNFVCVVINHCYTLTHIGATALSDASSFPVLRS